MKKFLIIAMGFFAIAMVYSFTFEVADTYTVIKVDGKITYMSSGSEMSRGDKFESSAKLDFKSTASRAAIVSKQKGRFVLTPKKKDTKKSHLMPAMSNVSLRSGEVLNVMDLKSYFSKDLVLLNQTKIKILVSDYPMNADNFFYLAYSYNGESISKKLDFEEKFLKINRNDLFMIDGNSIPVPGRLEVTLYHRDNEMKTSRKINTFSLASPDLISLKEELEILKEQQSNPSKSISEDYLAYVTEFYGKVDSDELNAWITNN